MDDSGAVNTADSSLLSRKISGASVTTEYGADVNRDGAISATDMSALIRQLSGAGV